MSTLVTIIHVICCLFLMLTVLLQSGKGGGMGAAFGGGGSATVFGGSGASTFLKKLTAGAATIFMITSMTLAYFASSGSEAVEGAMKLARAATNRPRFVAAERGYHGMTFGALSVSGHAKHRAPFERSLGVAQHEEIMKTSV